jgi:hypothetical protein
MGGEANKGGLGRRQRDPPSAAKAGEKYIG